MKTRTQGRPTLEQLRSFSRHGQVEGGEVKIVSRDDRPLRVVIRYGPRKVILQERKKGAIQLETGRDSSRRRSTETADWQEAVEEADQALRRMVIEDHLDSELEAAVAENGRGGRGAALEQLEDNFERVRYSAEAPRRASRKHMSNVRRVVAILRLKKGPDWRPEHEISENPHRFVEWYIQLRIATRISFPNSWNRRDVGPLRSRSGAIKELKDFAGVLQRGSEAGLLTMNPLRGYAFEGHGDRGDAGAVIHREEASLETVLRLLQPPVHPATGVRLLDAHGSPLSAPVHRTHASDGGGRLRYLLSHLAGSGPRLSSVAGTGGIRDFPRLRDLIFDAHGTRAALREAPNHRDRWARYYTEGVFVSNRNKMQFHRVLPLGRFWAQEAHRWLEHHPTPDDPLAPLIPAIQDWSKPVSETMVRKWYDQAVQEAQNDAVRMGLDPDDYLPRNQNSTFSGFRPLWRTTMSELGWDDAAHHSSGVSLQKHALFFGGWSVGAGEVQARVYTRLNPRILMAVANFEKASSILPKIGQETHARVRDAFQVEGDGDG